MTFIDWSSPDEMLGLLCEYVVDERAAASSDGARRRFLAGLADDLEQLAEMQEDDASLEETLEELRALMASQPDEFEDDPVLGHVGDCIIELERLLGERR